MKINKKSKKNEKAYLTARKWGLFMEFEFRLA